MALSMYQASVPVFNQMLLNLSGILKKAADFAESRKIDPTVLIKSRLFPDMLPLVTQVQIACDTAKGCTARLAGIDPPVMSDDQTNFDELINRIEQTLSFLNSHQKEQIEGTEDKTINYTLHKNDYTYKGSQYLLHKALPNFFFHITTAYAILRHNGLEIGKSDYIGTI